MATKTKTPSRGKTRRPSNKELTCPECGFKAAHPMGLGRHRSSRHGVASKRELGRRSAATDGGRGGRREIKALMKRLDQLEKSHELLTAALLDAAKGRTPRS
jgi:hypothetical protein